MVQLRLFTMMCMRANDTNCAVRRDQNRSSDYVEVLQQRFMFINEVVGPCKWERKQIESLNGQWPHRYNYSAQPFSVRLKEFWPLHRLQHVLKVVVPSLQHENDGLILQVRFTQSSACKWSRLASCVHLSCAMPRAYFDAVVLQGDVIAQLHRYRGAAKGLSMCLAFLDYLKKAWIDLFNWCCD